MCCRSRLTTQSVTADLSAGTASSSQTGNDSISGFENIIGGTVRDLLTGDAGANSLEGRNGNDKLVGGDGGDRLVGGFGRDALRGGTGSDALFGDNGHDALFGGRGDDFLSGGAGPDTLRGGPGIDTADYGAATGGVNADLVRGDARGMGVGNGPAFQHREPLWQRLRRPACRRQPCQRPPVGLGQRHPCCPRRQRYADGANRRRCGFGGWRQGLCRGRAGRRYRQWPGRGRQASRRAGQRSPARSGRQRPADRRRRQRHDDGRRRQ